MDFKFIQISDEKIKGVVSFGSWLEAIVDGAKELNTNQSRFRAGQRLLDAFEHPESGYMMVRSGDWEILKKIVESDDLPHPKLFVDQEVSGGQKVKVPFKIPGRFYLPFIDAVLNARDDLPAVLDAKGAP